MAGFNIRLPQFIGNYFVSAPVLWGKVPSRGDFVRHGLKAAHSQALQNWVQKRMAIEEASQNIAESKAMRERRAGWQDLSPAKSNTLPLAGFSGVPWAFVLPPGELSFAPKEYVMGVWMDSSDKVGRHYPLIMLQTASPRWFQQAFAQHHTQPRDWLFYAARLMARTVYAEETQADRPVQNAVDNVPVLIKELDALWRFYKPTWGTVFGKRAVDVDYYDVEKLIGQPHDEDVIYSMNGVRYPPWSDWQERLTGKNPQACLWQQDLQGRFVGVREN